MNLLSLPWLELAVLTALAGSLFVGFIRQPLVAFRWGLVFTGSALACSLLAWLAFSQGEQPGASLQPWLFPWLGDGEVPLLAVDNLSAPMVPLAALLHFLTALATGRTKMRRFSVAWSLASEAVTLATFGTQNPWAVMGLLAAGTIPGCIELINRGKPVRVYALHQAAVVVLLGFAAAYYPQPHGGPQTLSAWVAVPLMAAVLIRCGSVPGHCWVTDWFEHASLGNALLFVTPLTGVYAAVRLVLPGAPDWVLQGIGLVSLTTAVYAAGMATVQREARRFFAYLFLSHASLVLVGLELHTSISLTGALSLWVAVALSLHGFGLTLRALEARHGRLSLADFHGLFDSSPALAVCFILTGLASVGFPGTLGFVSAEILVDGAVEANPYIGLAVILAGALNGIAVVRAYFLLFTGTRHVSTVIMTAGPREWVAVLTLTALIVGGGLAPQPGVRSRYRTALEIVQERERRGMPEPTPGGPSAVLVPASPAGAGHVE